MHEPVYLIVFAAMVLSLPVSWWLIARRSRDEPDRSLTRHRATVDRLSAGTGFNMPSGGGDG